MTNAVYKHLFIFGLLALLAGCASEPINSPDEPSEFNENTAQGISEPQSQENNINGSFYKKSYSAQKISGDYVNNPAVKKFIEHMVISHGFAKDYLYGLFSDAERLESVIRLESPAPSTGPKKPHLGSWTRYRNKFLTAQHISNGVEFWRNNADAIEKASQEYGVDPEYIVGIIGVETYFGKNVGRTRTFDALSTLAFYTHRRAHYFASELENFLLMAREEGYEPRDPVGSWAGAMGLGQFMPSSFRRLAIDFDHNGRRDLWHPFDAVGSVAHYFAKSGWKYQSPVASPASKTKNSAVIELSTYQGSEYWQVFPNFKVIKRYNNSDKYAMAVHQLAQAIKARYVNG